MPEFDHEEYLRIGSAIFPIFIAFVIIGLLLGLSGIFPIFLFPIIILINIFVIANSKIHAFYKWSFNSFGVFIFAMSVWMNLMFYGVVSEPW